MIYVGTSVIGTQMACRQGGRSEAVSLAHAGIHRKNVALSYMRTFTTNTSMPEGFNSQDAIDMPLDESASMAIIFYGEGFLTATGQTAETGQATFPGEGFATFNGELGVNGQVTFPGEGFATAAGRTAEVGSVTMDAGARPTAFDIAQELIATPADGTVTIQQAFKIMLAALAGKVSGAGTSTITFRDVNDTKDRIVATVDSNGNRTGVTKDVS